ncbi:MAG: hypothetical protein LH609_08640 [Rudanella sp.]|nr:hypothetical protein [Rudanella sp.]
MEIVKDYLNQYERATTRDERKTILSDYQSFLKTLNEADREQARQFMQARLQPQIDQTMKSLDALTEQAEAILSQQAGKKTYSPEYVNPT